MLPFIRSSIRFSWSVTKWSFAAIVLWTLDLADLYTKFIAPNLPSGWAEWLKPYATWLELATPFIVALIVIWAILYTYYSLEKRVTRNPEIPRKLREFYATSDQFANFNLDDREEFPEWERGLQSWYNETYGWISENMSAAALSRFKDTSNILPVRYSEAISKAHNNLVSQMRKFRSNLEELIQNESWDEE